MARQIKVTPPRLPFEKARAHWCAGTNGNNYGQYSWSKVQSRHQKGPKHSTIQQWMLLKLPHHPTTPTTALPRNSQPLPPTLCGDLFFVMCALLGSTSARCCVFHFSSSLGWLYTCSFCLWMCLVWERGGPELVDSSVNPSGS